jgi:hypothetical protein
MIHVIDVELFELFDYLINLISLTANREYLFCFANYRSGFLSEQKGSLVWLFFITRPVKSYDFSTVLGCSIFLAES